MVTIFSLGSNGSGQLGIGHSEDVSVPKPIRWKGNAPTSVKCVTAGGNHTLFLGSDGNMYWAGNSSNGACGFLPPTEQLCRPYFTKMEFGRPGDRKHRGPVQNISATWEASIFSVLDTNGRNSRVYSCGLGEKGELGQGPFVVRDPYGTELKGFPPVDTEITDIASCMDHVVAVLSNGDVYGWGNGRKGQLGSPSVSVFSPRRVEGVGFPVKRAVCGKDFTCLLGAEESGQIHVLGLDKWNIKSEAPSAIPGWKDIQAGWSNILVLLGNGKLVCWGRKDYSLNIFPSPFKALEVAAGSEHALALLDTGDVLAWGWGEHGDCGPVKQGDGEKGQRNIIASSKFLPPGAYISAIAAGCATSWILIAK